MRGWFSYCASSIKKIQVQRRKLLRTGKVVLTSMPVPKRFKVASTSLPLAMGWGWNLCLYMGLLAGLLTLLLLLLWMLLRQLRHSVGKSTLQPVRSFRQLPLDQRFQNVLWIMWKLLGLRLNEVFECAFAAWCKNTVKRLCFKDDFVFQLKENCIFKQLYIFNIS